MANKSAPRNWNDVQLSIATVAMALTLVFWNLFAGPDREMALKRAQEQAARDQAERERVAQEQQAAQAQVAQPQPIQQQTAPQVVIAQPTATQMAGPLLFGGSAPRTVIVQGGGGGGGTGGGSGGGSGGGTGGS